MNLGETLHGFRVISSEYIEYAKGTLWLLKHEKHDTPLAFLERKDTNKSFYIAFRTLPEDDTGVFHIIEHSVLNGSEKFPVKEPFVELLKSSLKTFLNAMTYPDKTVYPVSSRIDKDFFNLVNVYMDAVFHPLMLKNENIFMQEGHRYELDEESGRLTVNGVVYNEMKGAMSSADEIASEALSSLLYPKSVYAKNSGGDPDIIPNLTYADFCAAHEKYYHPSNALIFLDGDVDLDSVLPLLDSYLREFDVRDERIEVGEDTPPIEKERSVKFEISPDDDAENMTRVYLGVRTFDFSDMTSSLMLSVLSDAIAGTNESPLVKAFLDDELCEDVFVYSLGDEIKYCSYAIELKNLACTKDEAYERLFSTLKRLAKEGIGRKRLEASLNTKEFKLREADFGTFPKGLVLGLAMLDGWIYGNSPSFGLKYEEALAKARECLDSDAYEKMLEDVFINNERSVRLTLIPSQTLAKEREEEERKRLDEIKSSLGEEEIKELLGKQEAFRKWQSTPDSEENLDTVPTLSISDIPKEGSWTPTDEISLKNGTALVHDLATGGISYAEMIFDASDLEEEELTYLYFISLLLGKCRTEKYSADELEQEIKLHLGSFSSNAVVTLKDGTPFPYLYITASALDSGRESLVKIVDEILNRTDFGDTRAIKNILNQELIDKRESIISAGHAAAVKRARAYVCSLGAIAESFSGFRMYQRLGELLSDFDAKAEAFTSKINAILKRIVAKKRLTLALTGTPCKEFLEKLAAIPESEGNVPTPCTIAPLGHLNEGIVIPSRVSYISKAATLPNLNRDFCGSMHVLSNVLSYTHLWNEIRVKGGAYGAGFAVRQSGDVSTYSYRDPNPASSVKACDGSASFLRALAEEEDVFDSYIIGAFGSYDTLHSARTAGMEATVLYIMGKTAEDEMRIREGMISFDKNELLRLADVTEDLMKNSAVCVIGPAEHVDECMTFLKNKLSL